MINVLSSVALNIIAILFQYLNKIRIPLSISISLSQAKWWCRCCGTIDLSTRIRGANATIAPTRCTHRVIGTTILWLALRTSATCSPLASTAGERQQRNRTFPNETKLKFKLTTFHRYRRLLRASEEAVEDVSIVPRRSNTSNCYQVRTVPEHTNPELVMFCRRAYEFRTRRLLKMPQKNALVCS